MIVVVVLLLSVGGTPMRYTNDSRPLAMKMARDISHPPEKEKASKMMEIPQHHVTASVVHVFIYGPREHAKARRTLAEKHNGQRKAASDINLDFPPP